MFQHFAAVAGASDLPLCIYNNPSTTNFTFSDELVARLPKVPGIVAVKNPAPPPTEAKARVDALRALVPTNFDIGYSGDWHSAEAVLAGGVAWYSVIGGLLPQLSLTLMQAAQAGDAAEVQRLNAAFGSFWNLFKQYGSIRVVYAAANLLGLTEALPPRPLLPLGADEQETIRKAMAALGV